MMHNASQFTCVQKMTVIRYTGGSLRWPIKSLKEMLTREDKSMWIRDYKSRIRTMQFLFDFASKYQSRVNISFDNFLGHFRDPPVNMIKVPLIEEWFSHSICPLIEFKLSEFSTHHRNYLNRLYKLKVIDFNIDLLKPR